MADVLAAMPSRPLHARPPGFLWSLVRQLLAILLFIGLFVFLLGWVGPVLLTDWQVRDAAVPIQGGHLAEGSCDDKLFAHICDLIVTAPLGDGTVTRKMTYVFGSLDQNRFRARVVGDPRQPDKLTTDLGLEHFWNRAVSLAVGAGIMLLLNYVLGRQIGRAVRNNLSWRRAALAPVPLKLVSRKGRVWTVQAENGLVSRWTMPLWSRPFAFGPPGQVLGLATKGMGAVMPLDSRLRWVQLSRAERAAVRAAARTARSQGSRSNAKPNGTPAT